VPGSVPASPDSVVSRATVPALLAPTTAPDMVFAWARCANATPAFLERTVARWWPLPIALTTVLVMDGAKNLTATTSVCAIQDMRVCHVCLWAECAQATAVERASVCPMDDVPASPASTELLASERSEPALQTTTVRQTDSAKMDSAVASLGSVALTAAKPATLEELVTLDATPTEATECARTELACVAMENGREWDARSGPTKALWARLPQRTTPLE